MFAATEAADMETAIFMLPLATRGEVEFNTDMLGVLVTAEWLEGPELTVTVCGEARFVVGEGDITGRMGPGKVRCCANNACWGGSAVAERYV